MTTIQAEIRIDSKDKINSEEEVRLDGVTQLTQWDPMN